MDVGYPKWNFLEVGNDEQCNSSRRRILRILIDMLMLKNFDLVRTIFFKIR